MRFAGKVAVVTGGGAGIGEGICHRLASEGCAVVVADIVTERAGQTAAALGDKARPFTMDVTDEDQAAAVMAFARRELGGLDFVVANAGITDRANALQMRKAEFERIVRTNLVGAFVTAQAGARAMVEAGTPGRIVTLASVSGQTAGTGRVAYGASKAGIINMTQVMAMEWARHNILVNAVAPGPVKVARTAHSAQMEAAFLNHMAIQRYAVPAEVAAAVAFLCSDDAGFITGHVLNVDGGFKAAGVLYDPDNPG